MKKDALIHTEEKHSATSHSNILLTSKRISRGTLQLQSVKVNTKQHNQATLRSTGGRILEKKLPLQSMLTQNKTIKHLEQTPKDALWEKAT